MATNVDIYNASYILSLDDSSVYGIELDATLGAPERNRIYSKPWKRGFSPLVGTTTYNRTCTMKLLLHGTSQDDWVTNYRQLAQLLTDTTTYQESMGGSGDQAYLGIQVGAATNTTVFDIISGELEAVNFAQASFVNRTAPIMREVTLSLMLRPHGHLQSRNTWTTTRQGATGIADTAERLRFTATAQIESPAKLTITPTTFNAAQQPDIRVVAGRKSHDNDGFIWAFDCRPGTYPGYAVSATAGGTISWLPESVTTATASGNLASGLAYANQAYRLTHQNNLDTATSVISWTIDASAAESMRGSYHAYIGMTRQHSTQRVGTLTYGGSSGDQNFSDVGTATMPQFPTSDVFAANDKGAAYTSAWGQALYDMGIIHIPAEHIPGNQPIGTFRMVHRSWSSAQTTASGAGRYLEYDRLLLIPIDEQYVDFRQGSASDHSFIADDLALRAWTGMQDSSGDMSNRAEQVRINARTKVGIAPGDNAWYGFVGNHGPTSNSTYIRMRLFDGYSITVEGLELGEGLL